MFDIRFVAPPRESEELPLRRGRITLGAFAQDFDAPLAVWTAERYEAQWRAAAERLVRGEARSGFFVWATDLKEPPYALWWPAWREGERIALENQVLFPKDLPYGLDLDAAYAQAHHVEPWFEDAEPSTWYVSPGDLAAFLGRHTLPFPG